VLSAHQRGSHWRLRALIQAGEPEGHPSGRGEDASWHQSRGLLPRKRWCYHQGRVADHEGLIRGSGVAGNQPPVRLANSHPQNHHYITINSRDNSQEEVRHRRSSGARASRTTTIPSVSPLPFLRSAGALLMQYSTCLWRWTYKGESLLSFSRRQPWHAHNAATRFRSTRSSTG
jgi:hypothetical protein